MVVPRASGLWPLIVIVGISLKSVLAEYKCGKAFHIEPNKPANGISFKMGVDKAQKCLWSIFGDVGCEVELNCKVNIKKVDGDCSDVSLRVSDGVNQDRFCGKTEFTTRASQGLRDLFVVLENTADKAAGNGIECVAKCLPRDQGAKRLSVEAVKKRFVSQCVCGLQNKDDRIVGGEDARANEFPWQAAIVYAGTRSPNCGGTIINDRYVLTATHCFWFDGKKPADIDVLLHAHLLDMTKKKNAKDAKLGTDGSIRSSGYNLSKKTDAEDKAQRYKVAEIIMHPLFTEMYDYDYALLRLDTRVNLVAADAPTPICLPPPNTFDSVIPELEGHNLTVTGWGMAAENAGGTTRILQKLEVPYINYDTCSSWLPDMLTQRMICAGYKDGAKDACTGDSGGPLVFPQQNKQWKQYGIVSWGEGCARAKRPGIYSRVTEMMAWVLFHTSDSGEAKWCKDDK